MAWGYAAAVSFLDAQLGRLLDVLDELRLWDDTTVILTSDHGRQRAGAMMVVGTHAVCCTVQTAALRVYGETG